MTDVTLKSYIEKYKKFVKDNPLVASEIEVALRWISYFAAGRLSKSALPYELMHSASSLLTLINDCILRNAANLTLYNNAVVEKLQTALSVIEYVEVFAELAAGQLAGPYVRWLIIVAIHMVKTGIRLLLLLKYDQGLHLSPSIPPLNRRTEVSEFCSNDQNGPSNSCQPNVELAFTLKRSGRVIRSIEAAPPLAGRTWKLPQLDEKDSKSRKYPPTDLKKYMLAAELLHIARPLVHLTSMMSFGSSSWKPWLVSLAMDTTSLQLLRSNKQLNYTERLELSRRALQLLLYILRSPFYEKFSKVQIIFMLSYLAENVRLLRLILHPVLEYLPEWQKTYFYTWSM